MEIVIPLDGGLQNCREYRVLREHDGGIEEIPAAGNQWGEYFVLNEDRTVLTIFAKRFSDYAVLYSNAQPDHGGDDSDSDDSSDSPAPAVTDPSEPAELPPENTVTPAPETASEPDTSAVPESPEEPESPAPEQPAEPSGTTDIPAGKPFVLLSAVGAAIAVLLAAPAPSEPGQVPPACCAHRRRRCGRCPAHRRLERLCPRLSLDPGSGRICAPHRLADPPDGK